MSRETNANVFEDTMKHCRQHPILCKSTEKAIDNQVLILEEHPLPDINRRVHSEQANLIVSRKRTLEAASSYQDAHVCVLNFASASNPGGGVVHGANAQEECLCRCSDLYLCLSEPAMWNGFYLPHRKTPNPLHNDDLIYTPGITVIKTDTAKPELMDETDWYQVNVITCAAPNLRNIPSNRYNAGDGDAAARISDEDLQALHEKRLRRILDVAVMEGNEIVILGAFGCGAFRNDPEVVARAARNVVAEYRHAFKTIEFAVYCSPRSDENFRVFERVLK